MKLSIVLGLPLALAGVSALATEALADEAMVKHSASDMLSPMKILSATFDFMHEVLAQTSKEVFANAHDGQVASPPLQNFTSVNSTTGDSSCNLTKSEDSPKVASDESSNLQKDKLRMAEFLNSVKDVTLAELRADTTELSARILAKLSAKLSYIEAECAAAEAREQAISAMRAFVAKPKNSTTEMAEMLRSMKASCKASRKLSAAEDLLQSVNGVNGDDQQRRLDLAAMKESSIAESKSLAGQVSRMLLVQSMVSGTLNNERMWISRDDLPENPEYVLHPYQLPKVVEE